MYRSQQDVIEALEIAALGKVKCQYEVRELEDINQYVRRSFPHFPHPPSLSKSLVVFF